MTIAAISAGLSTVWGIVKDILALFGIGTKSSDPAAAERATGEKLGIQETENAQNKKALDDTAQAVSSTESERAANAADPSRLRDGATPGVRPWRGSPD